MAPRPTLVPAALAAALCAAGPARASAVSNEVTLGSSVQTRSVPSTRFVGDRLAATLDVGEALSLRVGASGTRYDSTRDGASEDVFLFSGGGTLELSEHWSVGLGGTYSPTSTTVSTETATLDTGTGTGTPTATTLAVKTSTWSAGGTATIGWESAGTTDAETALDLGVGFTSYQVATAIPTRHPGNAAALCGTTGCTPELRRSLEQGAVAIGQTRLALGVTETLFEHTDVDVVGAFYAYTDDPSDVGILSIGTFGRTTVNEGIPTLPLRWSARAGVLRRFGPFGVGASVQHARFVADEGYGDIAGARVEWRASKALKVWLTGNVERDVDASAETLYTGWAGLGARLRF